MFVCLSACFFYRFQWKLCTKYPVNVVRRMNFRFVTAKYKGRDSVVRTVTRLRAGQQRNIYFDFLHGKEIFLSFAVSRPALGPTQVTGALFPGGKRQGHETDHSQSNVEVKNKRSDTFISPRAFLSCTGITAPLHLSVKYTALIKLHKFLKTGRSCKIWSYHMSVECRFDPKLLF
jgi:hypothetical protein